MRCIYYENNIPELLKLCYYDMYVVGNMLTFSIGKTNTEGNTILTIKIVVVYHKKIVSVFLSPLGKDSYHAHLHCLNRQF